MFLAHLLHAPTGSRLVRTEFDGATLTLGIATTHPSASCPLCCAQTWRGHSRYTRRLVEIPVLGHRVRLLMTFRRFFCAAPLCPRRVFTEPLDSFAANHARTSVGLARAHRAIGTALGGEAGARLAAGIAMATSPDTLLRRVKHGEVPAARPLRFVGIDDWALRKGQRYGTIVVDLETSAVVDLLPDRDAATVAAWLRAHPDVEVVSRDRSSAFSQAASGAAPEAQQVADCWHLLKNAREAVERRYAQIADALKPAAPDPDGQGDASHEGHQAAARPESPPQPSSGRPPVTVREEAALAKRGRRVERFERVHELRRGEPIRAIARELGMARNSVRRYLRCRRCPGWETGRRRRRSRLSSRP